MPEVQELLQTQTPELVPAESASMESSPISKGLLGGRVAAVISATFAAGLLGTLAVSYGRSQPAPLSHFSDLGASAILERQLRHLSDEDSEQAFTLHMSAGHVHRDQGQYENAVKDYTAARDLAARFGGQERLGAAQQSLGLAHYDQGRLQDARRDLEAAFVLVDGSGEHAAATLQAMGNVRREMGHLDEALKLYKKAWEVVLARGESEHLPRLATEFGEAYTRRGDIEQATSYFRQAIKQRQAINLHLHSSPSESDGPETAMTYSLLGGTHHMRGDIQQAVELYKKAFRLQSRVLRAGHPDLIGTQLSLARAQRDLGNPSNALDTIGAAERVLRGGPHEGPDLSRVLVLKADLLREQQKYQEAETSVEEALALQLQAFGGEEFPEVAVLLMIHGGILHDQHIFNIAGFKYERALQINLKTFGPSNPETAAAHNSLGTLHQDAGNHELAREHFSECLKIQLKTVGPASPDVSATYNNLATILFRQGKPRDAIRLFQKAVDVLDVAEVPKGNPDREVYEENLAEALRSIQTIASDAKSTAVPNNHPSSSASQVPGEIRAV